MKKINSIGYAHKVIGIGVLFLINALCFYLVNLYVKNSCIAVISISSLVIGGMILFGFTVLLFIELRQDRKIEKNYPKVRLQKISIGHNQFECQNCGNRLVSMEDKSCKLCGIQFR